MVVLQAENLLVAEDGRVLLADFGATARLEHARYSLPAPPHSDSSNSLSNISDSDASVNPSAPSSDGGSTPSLRMEVTHTQLVRLHKKYLDMHMSMAVWMLSREGCKA